MLLSTYELGRQPFSLASPAAWLRAQGHDVTVADLAVSPFPIAQIRDAQLVAFHLPMHTATRLALKWMERSRKENPSAQLCAYGLYAPLNAELLHSHGVQSIIGGEFEQALVDLAGGAAPSTVTPLDRLTFIPPDRSSLSPLTRYASLVTPDGLRVVGATEATRGCKHLCRHCPVVPVYQGAFRVVQAGVVLADIRSQVEAGASHITFGDPDFFNGPAHAMKIVEALHRKFPAVSYDVTIKVEHLLKHRDLLPSLRDTNCAFVTSAVESIDDSVLAMLEKGHTRRDFIETAGIFRDLGLVLNPTFITFTPWTTRSSYRELLKTLNELDLVDQTSPIQLAIRLLITANSRLLELDDVRRVARPFETHLLAHPWRHADPSVDALARQAMHIVDLEQKAGASRRDIFQRLWTLCADGERLPENFTLLPRTAVPYLNEPWYC